MSSYNDNLHSSVVSSLNTQELELQQVKSKQDASMFSLYYAQGARITASEKLEVTSEKYDFQQQVNGQAIVDSDISTNVLASAKNAKTYTDKSVTNTSVAAANLQIATNAIVKLSSNTGSILSIVSAGDFGTEIYDQAKNAAILMDNTAYVAEVASQKSMESSASISEVSTKTLVDKATVTDTSIKDLLTVVSTELEATNGLVQAETSEVSSSSTAEKKAEGQLEDLSVSLRSTAYAYSLSNRQLNLGLRVLPSPNHQKFTAVFNVYSNPFMPPKAEKTDGNNNDATVNPVDKYYVMLVKESKRQTFSISTAETLVTNENKKSYVEIAPSEANNGKISKVIYTSEQSDDTSSVLHDTDGNEFKLGEDYVLFILTVFTNKYKKSINTFDDYLSAASKMFTMTHKLSAPESGDLGVTSADKAPQELKFNILQQTDGVDYRCIFLPDNSELIDGLMTASDLFHTEKGILEDELKATYTYEINDLQNKVEYLKGKKSADTGAKDVDTTAIDNKIKEANKEIEALNEKLTKVNTKIKQDKYIAKPGFFFNLTIAEQIPAGSYTNGDTKEISIAEYLLNKYPTVFKDLKDSELKKLNDDIKKLIKDFFTGKSIIVLFEDYKKILKDIVKVEKKVKTLLKDNKALQDDFDKIIKGYKAYSVHMDLAPETTDNFGNRLIADNLYIPAVLVLSTVPESEQKEYTNALSDFAKTASFTYHTENQNNSYEAVNTLVDSQEKKCKK
ncbi:hypothetical protein [Kordia sp.]|uniref:hypothetical protein n=1 Tax=Kordia sp. TaxID=1965332 RepID=UPI003D2A2848